MEHISIDMLRAAVEKMNEVFDSHGVIRHIMRTYPQAYVRELYSRVTHSDPILTTHSEIGRALGRLEMIEKAHRVDSPNVRGEVGTENQGWRKIKQST